LSTFAVRKNAIFLVFNPISLLIAFLGLRGAIKMNKNLITLHAVITTSVFGSFMLYQIIEVFV
jgi:hypothetical protein